MTEKKWPKIGQTLVHKSRNNETFSAEVLKVDKKKNKISVRVGNVVYPSLSSAAESVGGYVTNGWIFWGLKKQDCIKE